MFPSLRNMETQHSVCVPHVCAPKKHHEGQCVRSKVSSFAKALTAVAQPIVVPSAFPLKEKLWERS